MPALKVLSEERYRIHVYPRLKRRFTVAARVDFRAAGAAADGLVASAMRANDNDGERLLSRMVEIAMLDESPERLTRARSTTPQEWLQELKGVGCEWLSDASDNMPEGPIAMGWPPEADFGTDRLSWRDRDVYRSYLSEVSSPRIAPSTSVSEALEAYRTRTGVLYKSYAHRNLFCLSLICGQLEGYLAAKEWTGWDDFHRKCPDASGILVFSAVGYSENFRHAYFSVFNRCDPRLLTSENEHAGSLEYLERVWLEASGDGWRVSKKVRLHARPIDFGPSESRCWRLPGRIDEDVHPGCKGTWQIFNPPLLEPCETQVLISENEIHVGDQIILSEEIEEVRIVDAETVRILASGSPLDLVFDGKPHVVEEFVRCLEWAGAFASRIRDGTLRVIKEKSV